MCAHYYTKRASKGGLRFTIINNEFNFSPAQKRRTDACHVRKMTPRAPQIFLISSAQAVLAATAPPRYPFLPLPSFLFPLRNVFYAPARSYTHITCLHSGLSRKSCSTGAFFFFSLLSGALFLFPSHSLHLSSGPHFQRGQAPCLGLGCSPVTYICIVSSIQSVWRDSDTLRLQIPRAIPISSLSLLVS